MGKIFTLNQSGPTCMDCTAPYSVSLKGKPTVGEFLVQVLENSNEWGGIRIKAGEKTACAGYRYGSIDTGSIAGFMGMKIKKATARGGWSNMDYTLVV